MQHGLHLAVLYLAYLCTCNRSYYYLLFVGSEVACSSTAAPLYRVVVAVFLLDINSHNKIWIIHTTYLRIHTSYGPPIVHH